MTEKPSRFSDLLRTRQESSHKLEEGHPVTPKRGRPGGGGKRLNPDYSQVTAYIPAKLHDETKINLIRDGKREFSELIEELLLAWNRNHPSK